MRRMSAVVGAGRRAIRSTTGWRPGPASPHRRGRTALSAGADGDRPHRPRRILPSRLIAAYGPKLDVRAVELPIEQSTDRHFLPPVERDADPASVWLRDLIQRTVGEDFYRLSPISFFMIDIDCSLPDCGSTHGAVGDLGPMRRDALGRQLVAGQQFALGQRDVRRLEHAGAGADDRIGRRVLADQVERGRRDLLRRERLERLGREQVFVIRVPRRRGDRVDLDVVLRAFEVKRLGQPGETQLGGAVIAGRNCRTARSTTRSSGCGHSLVAHRLPYRLGAMADPLRWTSTTNLKSAGSILAKLLSRSTRHC